jgi:two-component system, chemotaxis family, protein-glutamate methylesterase/glutaminase
MGRQPIGRLLAERLQNSTGYVCKLPHNGEPIKSGHVYIGPPDVHLLIKNNKIVLGKGPAENRWRPSIDTLFRSAAAELDGAVIGVILTGMLDDGVAGMVAIKKCGGTLIAQDPKEAEYPEMPVNVIENIEVNFILPLTEMGKKIAAITKTRKQNGKGSIPREVELEAELAQHVYADLEKVESLSGGKHSVYSCPACGGGLWQIKSGKLTRYRCHVGHAYTENDLLHGMEETTETSLWIAIRIMEEKRNLLLKMSRNGNGRLKKTTNNYKQRADEIDEHIERLKSILFKTKE